VTTSNPHSKPRRLAADILAAAIADRWTTVSTLMTRLSNECPGEGITEALLGWCDTTLNHASGGAFGTGQRLAVMPLAHETGQLGGDLAAETRWAMDLLNARASMNLPAFRALLGQINAIADGHERGQYAGALVQCCALTIRDLPYGGPTTVGATR
jgi:hypothetical protein